MEKLTVIEGEGLTEPSPDVLGGFWGVVMEAENRRTYLWSPEGWKKQDHYSGTWFVPRETPHPVFPAEHIAIVHAFAALRQCYRCYLDVDQHLIAPNPWGTPTQYCVQVPEPTVVGGGGKKKHSGSTSGGCHATSWHWQIRLDDYPRLHPTFDDPLVASEIRDRPWCSRCAPNLSEAESRHHEASVLLDKGKRWWVTRGLSALGLEEPEINMPDGSGASWGR